MDLNSPELWVAVGFVILVVAVYKPAKRALVGMLDARAAAIRTSLDEAATLRTQAQQLLAEYQRKQRDAIKETEELVAHAREEAARLAEQGERRLEEALERREQMALEKIAQAEADALREVRAMSIEIAIAATRSLIAARMDEGRAGALIDSSISDLSTRLH